jgi:ribosomal protein S18 acetylase RimI-like enzyme
MKYLFKFYNDISSIPENYKLQLKNNMYSIEYFVKDLLVDYFNTDKYFIMFVLDNQNQNLVGILGIVYMPAKHKNQMLLNFKEKTFHVGNVFIFPTYRGQGLCKVMLTKIINYINKKSLASRLKLDIDSNNVPAIKCYESVGFKKYNNEIANKWINNNCKKIYGDLGKSKLVIYTLKL